MVGYNLRSRKNNGPAVTEPGSAIPANVSPAESVQPAAVSSQHQTYPKPVMSELNRQVQAVVAKASWWDLFGVDWCIILSGCLLVPPGLLLLRSNDWGPFLTGLFLLGLTHSMLETKVSHLSTHNALCHSKMWSKVWQILSIEFFGGFSTVASYDAHIKIHHPYTNVIGLGDSSIWRVPFLPMPIYMFIAPLVLPIITPLVAIAALLQERKFLDTINCVFVISAGLVCHVIVLMYVSHLSCMQAILCIVAYRSFMEIPYIHINIFQHIGLPMFSKKDHPPRIQLMASGALNLSNAPFLIWNFGHSLIDCHVEHHMFPNLSDNMCSKVKPLVKEYMLSHGLPYHEKDYWERLEVFVKRYEELMVHAPPITEFIGVQ